MTCNSEIRRSQHSSFRKLPSFYAKTRVSVILILILLVILLTGVKIGSAQPTQVVTEAATNITDTSAQLNGVINPGVSETEWIFAVYDSSGALIHTIDHGFVGANTIASVETQDTSLQPSTTYGFKLMARWVGMTDWEYGDLLSFTTSSQIVTMNTMMSIYTNVMTAFFSSTTTSTTSSQPLGPGFDFTISVSPATASVIPGGTAQYAVGVTYSDPSYAGTMINVQLTGLGPGMDYALSQNGALTITTSPTTPTGSYPFTIIGSASGVTHQTGGTLIVTQSNSVSTAPVTITTPPTTTSSLVATVTSVVTQTATVQPSPTSTESSISNTQTTTSNVIGLLQQNSLLIIAILVIALAAVLLSGRRRSTDPATQTQPQTANVTYCSHCGTQNSTTNSYCRNCGTKLS